MIFLKMWQVGRVPEDLRKYNTPAYLYGNYHIGCTMKVYSRLLKNRVIKLTNLRIGKDQWEDPGLRKGMDCE